MTSGRGLRLAALTLIFSLHLSPGAAATPAGAWVYLRGGEAPRASERLVEVLAVGDVMPGRGLVKTPDLFAHVSAELRSADLTIGNLEGAIAEEPAAVGLDGSGPAPASSQSHVPPGEPIRLLLPPDTPAILAQAGFELLGLANNHALDAGSRGLGDTRHRLQAAGLEPVEAGRPVTRTMNGLKLTVLAWNDLGAPDHQALLEAVREAQAAADVVLVLVHWGQEYQRHPALPQRGLAGELVAAGADAVLGSHPHVVQDLELVRPQQTGGRTQLVAHSLGNFAFDQGWDDTAQGLALRLFFDAQGLRAAQALPLWTAPRPHWMAPEAATELLARILPHDRLGFTCSAVLCKPTAVPKDSRSGILRSGAIDLTGDGVPEIVRRQGQTVEILQDGRLAWRSPPEWQIRDFALGDPNHDGRYEALLAIDKAEGTSQPFIIGYRGGSYHDLWGGSPVQAPILEIELGDLDSDGLGELAVIEAAAKATAGATGGNRPRELADTEASPDGSARYVTVWRWHGWGFGLVWRSEPGDYRDLLLLPAQGGLPARLSVSSPR